MSERGLDQWDAAIARLREVLEIYIQLDDREMIGRSFTDLGPPPLSGLATSRKRPKRPGAGLPTCRPRLALTGRAFSPLSRRRLRLPESIGRPTKHYRKQ
jgi:hypothetical protein